MEKLSLILIDVEKKKHDWGIQMKKIRDKIVHFEKLDLEMERSRKQLEEMKNLLFTDQLNIFFHTRKARKDEDRVEC